MRPLRLMSMVWGDTHLDWFARACVASLAQPGNRASLRRHVAVWDIVTDKRDVPAARMAARALDLPIEMHVVDTGAEGGVILQRELINAMRRCLASDMGLLLAPPDSMFGEGSIGTICALAKPRDLCIAVPHVRVTPGILHEPAPARSNAYLVGAAWRHLHRTWSDANAELPLTNTYAGGVSWREVGAGLYAVTHRLPTVYLAQFRPTDLQWWEAWTAKSGLVGAWDHFWPSLLVTEGRQRVVGSSDAAFIAEVTPKYSNIPPLRSTDPDNPDDVWGQSAHFIFNRNHVSIFRAEQPQ